MSHPDLTHAALVVVDLQEDFCPPAGSLAIPGGRMLAKPINRLLQLPWAVRIATQDWHPQTHVSFASNHGKDAKPLEQIDLQNPLNPKESFAITLWHDHCVQDTEGAKLIPELDAAKIDRIVKKGQYHRVEMFSAFRDVFENPCVVKSDLASIMADKEIKNVFVVGLARDYCVKYTAYHAAAEGFSTTVLVDGTNGFDDSADSLRQLSQEFKKHKVQYLTIAEAGFKLNSSSIPYVHT